MKAIFYIISETFKITWIIYTSGFYFIVNLETNNSRMFGITLHQFSDNTLTIMTINRISQIHILADTIIALFTIHSL